LRIAARTEHKLDDTFNRGEAVNALRRSTFVGCVSSYQAKRHARIDLPHRADPHQCAAFARGVRKSLTA